MPKNSRHMLVSADVFESVDKFTKQHGLVKKKFNGQALLNHLDLMEEKLNPKTEPKELMQMKLQLMNEKQFFITLPNQIVRAKGWTKGDSIKAVIDGKGDIVLKKE